MSGHPPDAAPGRDDWRAELRREYARTLPGKHAHIERRLVALAATPADPTALEALFAAVHRLHGSAGSYGFTELSRLAGEWEQELLVLRDAGGRPSAGALEAMRARLDALRRLERPGPARAAAPDGRRG